MSRQVSCEVPSSGARNIVGALASGLWFTAMAMQPVVKDSQWDRVGRNDPCPCGTGKKFKFCHGR